MLYDLSHELASVWAFSILYLTRLNYFGF